SCQRYLSAQPTTLLSLAEHLGAVPDVIGLSGWQRPGRKGKLGGGYGGVGVAMQRGGELFGKRITYFTDSHERSHILGTIGMAPKADAPLRAVLVWEGIIGSLYLVDDSWTVTREIPVLSHPGHRYAHLFGIADPGVAEANVYMRHEVAGKLMALAGFGSASDPEPE